MMGETGSAYPFRASCVDKGCDEKRGMDREKQKMTCHFNLLHFWQLKPLSCAVLTEPESILRIS